MPSEIFAINSIFAAGRRDLEGKLDGPGRWHNLPDEIEI
jgi:hypothetical protein